MGDSVAAGPDLFLDARDVVPDMLLASGLGIGGIGGLPTEVVRMIRDHSSSSLFWRYSAVLDLTRALRAAPSDALSVPLARVRMWERGRHPEIEEAPGRPQAVRLTIDSYGIRRIEALAGSPSYQQRRTDQLAFVILEADKIQGVTAHFKICYARLDIHPECEGPYVWDTPSPPDLRRCLVRPAELGPTACFRTIELAEVSGITFFVHAGDVYATHAHTCSAPRAEASLERLSRRGQRSVVWVHVPISPTDSIAEFGVGEPGPDGGLSVLLRLRLAGDIVVGNAPPDAKFRTTASPSALIHDVPELNPISIFGAHSAGGRPFRNAVLSTAPLGNVRRLSVFRGGPKGFCTGMLLEYADGAQRALGQCRVGVDPVEAHAGPSGICLGLRLYTEAGVAVWLQTTDVRVAGGEECGHEREGAGVGYSCFPMRGDLQFCFSDKETLVQIKN